MAFQLKAAMLDQWTGSYDYWESLARVMGMTLKEFCDWLRVQELSQSKTTTKTKGDVPVRP